MPRSLGEQIWRAHASLILPLDPVLNRAPCEHADGEPCAGCTRSTCRACRLPERSEVWCAECGLVAVRQVNAALEGLEVGASSVGALVGGTLASVAAGLVWAAITVGLGVQSAATAVAM